MGKEFVGCQGMPGADRINRVGGCGRVGEQARIWQADGFSSQEHVLTHGPSG